MDKAFFETMLALAAAHEECLRKMLESNLRFNLQAANLLYYVNEMKNGDQ